MRITVVFLILVAGIETSWCQNPGTGKLDSLNRLLNKAIDDTVKVDLLINMAGATYLSSPSTAIKYCEEARMISEKIRFDDGLANALGWLAYLNEQQGEIERALDYYRKALLISEKNKNKKDEADILNNIAAIYKDQGRIEDALSHHRRSLEIKRQIGDKEGMSTSFNNLGLIYSSQGKIEEALENYMRALKIEEELKNENGIAVALQNISSIYRDQQEYEKAMECLRRALELDRHRGDQYNSGYSMSGIGNLYDEMGALDSALFYFRMALKVRTEIEDKQGMAYSLKYLGSVYRKQGRVEEAESSFRESLRYFETLGDKWGMASVTNLLGELLLATGKESEAEKQLNTSLRLAQQLGYPLNISNAAGNLLMLYRKRGQWKQAMQMNDVYLLMRDSVLNDKNRKAVMRTQFKYEFEKKEAALKSEQEKKEALAKKELQKQKLVRNGFMGGFAVMMLFAAVFLSQRNTIRKGKKRSDELLLNILPEEVAEELKQKGHADARQFDLVTVMFTDFKGFTQISERLSPAELVAEIDTCFKVFDEIITRHNIEKIKTIGDSYMCAGGLPVSNQTHAEDVVTAALEIQQFMQKHFRERRAEGKEVFEIRIGIHSGPVVAGIVGVKKFAYDIWGDTVNIASRLESSGEAGKVNISESTYVLVKGKFNCTHRGKITAKNKGEIDMYFVEAEKERDNG